jgi:DNA-binding Lrp family transcriptional regulator
MVESLPTVGAPDPRGLLSRQAARLSLHFFLDLVEIGRSDRNIIDSLLWGAIIVANLATIGHDPGLQRAYADIDAAAPDDLRRPVSINAIAQSLRQPFETTRRRVNRLARDGAVVITPRGVYVPNSVTATPAFLASVLARHERLRLFYEALKAIDALPIHGAAPSAPAPESPPIRITNRAVAEYMLRATNDLTALTGDPLRSLILISMAHENTAHLAPEDLADWIAGPERLSRPVRIARLAARLNLSPETNRRHTIALEAAGFCHRSAEGLTALAPPAARPTLERVVEDNLANVQRMFARLRQLGALAAWDVQPKAATG